LNALIPGQNSRTDVGLKLWVSGQNATGQNATDRMPPDKMPPTVEFVFIFFKISAKFYSKYKTPTYFL